MSWEYQALRRSLGHGDHPSRQALEAWMADTWSCPSRLWWEVDQHLQTDHFLHVSKHKNLLGLKSLLFSHFGKSTTELWPVALKGTTVVLIEQHQDRLRFGLQTQLRELNLPGPGSLETIRWSDGTSETTVSPTSRQDPKVSRWLLATYNLHTSNLTSFGKISVTNSTISLDRKSSLTPLICEFCYELPELKTRRARLQRLTLSHSDLRAFTDHQLEPPTCSVHLRLH